MTKVTDSVTDALNMFLKFHPLLNETQVLTCWLMAKYLTMPPLRPLTVVSMCHSRWGAK